MVLRSKILPVIFALSSLPWNANAEMTVGAEFEFVDPDVRVVIAPGLKGHEKAMSERLVEAIRAKCGARCREVKVKGKWAAETRFHLPSGFWIKISWDPNVVEVTNEPMTLSQFKKIAPEIQEYLFDTAYEIGLTTDPEHRAGHFNFGAYASFDGRADEFMKFIVDFANRPELASGILRPLNTLNAPPLAILKPQQRINLAKIARGFANPQMNIVDLGLKERDGSYYWAPKPSELSLQELAEVLIEHVFNQTFKKRLERSAPHYQALAIRKVPEARSAPEDRPAELRSIRSQRNVEDFILLAELVEGRISYLRSLPPATAFSVTQTKRVDFSPENLVDRFYIYVVEAGLSWDKFKNILPDHLLPFAPAAFLTSPAAKASPTLSLERYIDLLDLIPSSPWLTERLQSDWKEGSTLSSKDRLLVRTALQRLSKDQTLSPEAKKEYSRLLEKLSLSPKRSRCVEILVK